MVVKSYLFSGHVHDWRKQRQGARNQLRTAATYLGLSSVEDGGPQPSGRVADRVTDRVMSQAGPSVCVSALLGDPRSPSTAVSSDGPDET